LERGARLGPFRRSCAPESTVFPFADRAGAERRPRFDRRVLTGDEVVTDPTLAQTGHAVGDDVPLAELVEELQHFDALLDERWFVAVVEQLPARLIQEPNVNTLSDHVNAKPVVVARELFTLFTPRPTRW